MTAQPPFGARRRASSSHPLLLAARRLCTRALHRATAQVPFGALRLGPDTTLVGDAFVEFDHYGGYNFEDTHVRAFSHTHMVGAGVGDFGSVCLNARTQCCQTQGKTPGFHVLLPTHAPNPRLACGVRADKLTWPGGRGATHLNEVPCRCCGAVAAPSNFGIMPTRLPRRVMASDSALARVLTDPKAHLAKFSHANESAEPGYYAVALDIGHHGASAGAAVRAELVAATTHVGAHR